MAKLEHSEHRWQFLTYLTVGCASRWMERSTPSLPPSLSTDAVPGVGNGDVALVMGRFSFPAPPHRTPHRI